MKKSLLMTTALVAAFSATNVCAEDWTISSKETITDELISRDNVTVATGGDITISGNNSGIISNGNFTMEDGNLTASSNGGSADTGVFVRGENSSVTIKNGTINLTEARIAKGEEDTDTTGDVNISGGKIPLNNQAYIEMYDTNTGSVNLSGGELNINDNSGILLDGANNFTMTGGTLTATSNGNSADTGVFVKGDGADINIQDGDINLTDSRIYKGNDTATSGDINISGGNITLNKNAYIEMRKENTGNVNMTGGKLVMNENSGLLLNTNDNQEIDGNAIKLIVNGDDATIIANGNNQISGDIDFTKGTITVANGASLTSGDIAMNSENAKIDLSGKLDTNVSGSGNLCFKSSAANISGNVTGSNLTFEADHSLSKAIGETISNITALNVSKGTLTYDKDTGSIGNVSVAGGAGLDIGTNKLTATTVDFADNSTLGLKVASADNYGQINANTINANNIPYVQNVIILDKSKGVNIAGNSLTGAKKHGINLTSSSASISANTISGNKENGIFVNECKGKSKINGDTIKSNKQCGIAVQKGNNVTINSAKISKSGKNGIYIFKKSKVTINKCTVSSNKKDGIYSTLSSTTNIKKGTVSKNKGNGIYYTNKAKGSINGVKIQKNKKKGIYLTKKVGKIKITKVKYAGNKGGKIQK